MKSQFGKIAYGVGNMGQAPLQHKPHLEKEYFYELVLVRHAPPQVQSARQATHQVQ